MAVEYITKQQALEAIRTNSIWQPGSWAFGAIKKALESIPAADVKPVVRGVWIPTPCDMENANLFACSECKHLMYVSDDYDEPNYCPNCGADMREVEHD